MLMILITGCSAPTITSMPPVATLTKSSQMTPMPPTSTSVKVTSTVTLTPTEIPTRTPIPTLTASPTFTPRPILSIEDAKALIVELVQEHEDCQLPCLWGFTPGIDQVKIARAFVKQFGIGDFWIGDIELSAHNYGSGGGVGISYPKDEIFIIVDWSYYKSKESPQLELLTMHLYPMEEIGTDPMNQLPIMSPVYGNATFNREFQDYLLPSILSTYGQPSHVLIMARPDEPGRPDIKWYPFSLAVIYPEQGIFLEYVSPRESMGENYVGCPDKSHIYLATWDPQSDIPWENVVDKAGSEIRMSNSKPLDEATSLTLDDFYHIFMNPENTTCLETSIELWSEQQ